MLKNQNLECFQSEMFSLIFVRKHWRKGGRGNWSVCKINKKCYFKNCEETIKMSEYVKSNLINKSELL